MSSSVVPTLRVVVSGASGLLGRSVVDRFLRISLFSTPSSSASSSSSTSQSFSVSVHALAFSRLSALQSQYPPSRYPSLNISRLDLTNSSALSTFFASNCPHVFIHCAAERRPDKMDANVEESMKLNVDVTKQLAKLCLEKGVLLLFISTDYVFDGRTAPYIYSTSSLTNPLNLYGKSKVAAETAIRETFSSSSSVAATPTTRGSFAIFRIPVLYGKVTALDESAVTIIAKQILDAKAEQKIAKLDGWQKRYPTNTHDIADGLARFINSAIKQFTSESPHSQPQWDFSILNSIYHFAAKECYTKYDTGLLICSLFNLPNSLVASVSPADSNSATAERPYDVQLDTTTLEAIIGKLSTRKFAEGLKHSIDNLMSDYSKTHHGHQNAEEKTAATHIEIRQLPVKRLTPENFAPYGEVIRPSDVPNSDITLDLAQGVPRFYLMPLTPRGLQFDRITRHCRTTQCLGSVDQQGWYMGFAAPNTELEVTNVLPSARPALDTLSVFYIPPGLGVKMHKGTWHAGPLFDYPQRHMFYNLELFDTNEVDHHTHVFSKHENLSFEFSPVEDDPNKKHHVKGAIPLIPH